MSKWQKLKLHHRFCLATTVIGQLSLGVLFNSVSSESISYVYFILCLGEFNWLLLQPYLFKSRVPEQSRPCHSVSIATKETNLPQPSTNTNLTTQKGQVKKVWIQGWLSPLVWLSLQYWKTQTVCLQRGHSCSCQFSLCKSLWLDSLEVCLSVLHRLRIFCFGISITWTDH